MKLNTLLLAAAAILAVVAPTDRANAQAATKEKKATVNFPDMSVKDVQKAIKDGKVTIIDVNPAASYKAGHLPGAVHWTAVKDDLASALPKDKDALILAYCGGPTWGAWRQAAVAAKKLGYTNIKHMKVGISGWKAAKADVEKAADKKHTHGDDKPHSH